MAETVNDTQVRLTAFIQENFPLADVSPGSALSELVVKLAATVQNQIYNEIATLSQANSVEAALASPTDTYSPIIDEVASNYNTTRFAGAYSTGNLKMVLSKNQNINIPQGVNFIQTNLDLTYVTTQAYSYSINANATNGQLPIFTQNGIFYIIIPVRAASVGSQYQVSDQTQFTAGAGFTNPNLVSITAYGNFSSGLPEDTDKELIAKFQTGLSNKSLTSQSAISNYLSSNFPSFQTVSCIGANDPEMVRDKQNIFGLSTFGMADIYVRTSVGPSTITITKPATKTADGIWTMNIGNTDCPGFYSIKGILPAPVNNTINSAGTLIVNSTSYGYAPLSGYSNNQIPKISDARFTAYQTATVVFQYTETPTVNAGTNADFLVTFLYQPNILDIQDVFLNDATRNLCGDYLVKAVVPCFASMQITLVRQNTTDTAASIGIPALQQDIFNYVNGLRFGQPLAASMIVDICHKYPIQRVELPIQLTGNIYTINGTTQFINSSDELVIPTDIPNGVSENTTLFFVDYYTVASGQTTPVNSIAISLV